MGTDFSNMMSAFWMTVMEKLNSGKDKKLVIDDVIKDICRYFNFGCSFVYHCNEKYDIAVFSAYHAYLNHEHLTNRFNIRERLGEELYDEFLEAKCITFDRLTKKTRLDEEFMELFRAQSMILVPFKNREGELISIIGMVDRRGESREGDQDLNFAYYILMVLGNYDRILLTQTSASKSMRQLFNILDSTGLEVYVVDYHTDEILYANKEMEERYVGSGTIIGKTSRELSLPGREVPGSSDAAVTMVSEKSDSDTKTFNMRMYDGSYRKFISSTFTWVDGRLAQSISSVDITQTVKNEETIRYHAKYDQLTGLGNRHKLLLDCDDGIERLKDSGGEGCLIFGDLNRFKSVNDAYGHNVGDEILACIGKYFNESEETTGRAYRYAGDEFVVICFDKTEDEACSIIDRVEKRFEQGWEVSVGKLVCTISMGITKFPTDAGTTSDLLHQADLKMYERKKNQTL